MTVFKDVKRYAYIYGLFIKNCLISQMEYRFNFLMSIAIELGFLLAKALYAIVVYQTGIVINGLSPDAILMFIGTYTMMTGIYWGFLAMNFIRLPDYVRDGTLDMYITKPISLQFMVTLRTIDFGLPIPNVGGGLVMVIIAWNRLHIPVTFGNIAGFIALMISGLFITYAVFLFPQMLSFWIVKTNAINDISNAVWDFNNMPMGIYNRLIQRIGIYALPIFIISNFPPMFVLKTFAPIHLVWAVVAPVVFMMLNRVFWRFAVRNYSSASS